MEYRVAVVVRKSSQQTQINEAEYPKDLVNRDFRAGQANDIWVADYTYVSTWQGIAYVVFFIDMYADRIVSWKLSTSQTTDFILDALQHALNDRDVTVD